MSPKLPIRTAHIELDGEFAGFWVEIRTNPPMRVFEEFASQDIKRVIAALAVMTRASNLVDENDRPVDLTTVAGWEEMPSDLLAEVAVRLRESLGSPKAKSPSSSSPSTPEEERSLVTTT